MNWNEPYVLFALADAVIASLLAVIVWRRRPATGATPNALLLLALAIWALGYTFELASPDLSGKIFWSKIEYVGIVGAPLAWLAFALEYTNRARFLSRRNLALLAIHPIVTLALVWTNEAHNLFWSRFELDFSSSLVMGVPTDGPLFWVHATYSYILILISTILLIQALLGSAALYRKQATTLLIATIAPWIGNAAYLSGLNPFPHFDLTPFCFTVTGVMMTWGLFRYGLLDIVPIARATVVESLRDAVLVLDVQNRIVDVNRSALAMLERTASEVIGKQGAPILTDYTDWVERFRDVSETTEEITKGTGDAQQYFVLQISPLYSDQRKRLTGRLCIIQDITERKWAQRELERLNANLQNQLEERQRAEEALSRLNDELETRVENRTAELTRVNVELARENAERSRVEQALRESEERYALAARGANDGIWDWKLETDEIYLSPRWKSMLGYKADEIGSCPDDWFKRVHLDDIAQLKTALDYHLKGVSEQFEFQYRMLHKDETYRWMQSRGLAVRDQAGKVNRLAGSQTDITARKLAEEQLLHDALHDALTGLPNRALFMDRTIHTLEIAHRRAEYLFAVLFLDLDRFKVINDSLGHLNGDKLLIAAAKRLEKCIRAGDSVARLGGDEFVILLEQVEDAADAIQIAERIQEVLSTPFELNGIEAAARASIGIALGSHRYALPEDILRDADIAMYRSKALGGGCHVIFDQAMHAQALSLMQLEGDLRHALQHEELALVYQPIVSLTTGHLTGVEALLRWHHPRRGAIPPSQFIAIAEESGLIIPLGEWVLRQACLQMKAWHQGGFRDLFVAVNVSGRQFSGPSLSAMIDRVLEESTLRRDALHLEITETTATRKNGLTIQAINELKSLGVRIAIDDFGNDYSALGRLKNFPVDVLKIDQSFIRDIPTDKKNAAITSAIITMAHRLKMCVVAEGVETEEQRQFLIGQHCDEMQGYLFSRPVSAKEITTLLGNQSLDPSHRLFPSRVLIS